ncbi:DUF1765-domain-containing protein [Delitschia confertaspora ATCC 74209]|uniref:DUF1765-domain-containing protein n=1 Tax=Delitschia confertaspora ATCC 74209 TaxID=1513339 RepID=A0A9P4JI79_9PLEO|nr:DUF1765-domain-containing protein [Delitschia confertaspora ATCC 74209]
MATVIPPIMDAAIPAMDSHDPLMNTSRGRNRSASEAAYPIQSPPPPPGDRDQLPRAASYTYFPTVKELLDDASMLELKGSISEDDLKSNTSTGDRGSYSSSNGSSPDTETVPSDEKPLELKRTPSRRSSRIINFSTRSRESGEETKVHGIKSSAGKSVDSLVQKPSTRPLNKLRRKSWISPSSRSSSPGTDTEKPDNSKSPTAKPETSKRRSLHAVLSSSKLPKSNEVTEKQSAAKTRMLPKKSNKSFGGLFGSSNTPDPSPAVSIPPLPSVPKSFSTERLPSFTQSPTSHSPAPPIPRNLSPEKLRGVRTEPRKKDELWSVFRTLEGDLRKFHGKSIALKANVVRTTLLSFLRSYAAHPSNQKLRPEDLDRRVNILNGWWTGLLELLAGRNNQSLSGTDRPAILEGITGIMERPEWRLSPSPFCALLHRGETPSSTATSVVSLSSGTSDFLAESVYHNVKNTFTQNLLSQMALVVDKMSLRNAAASLVTFCGKTCAYAFCFCPGVADVLVRLWDLSMDSMRRVLEESGISRQDKLELEADNIVPPFPPTLHSLKFHSLAKTARLLRRPVHPPLGTGHLDWHGPWLKRWSGAESDLFYVFVKHYHILVTEFLPGEPTDAERICVPGLVMVHAQVLANLDATINRSASLPVEEPTSGPALITFDDVLSGDPDTSASALPIPPANATRQMAENRLIMLIRDFLSERNIHLDLARRVFAEGFGRILKAAARKVSVYDNNACYTLCDFLEESLVILVRYEQQGPRPHSILDWPFWLSVCKQMTASQNTVTEIKLFAFLYSSWSTIVTDEHRKATLCLEFLLEPEFFESRFSHWCPMVRCYFMRLLCWRVARFDGEETASELNIIKSLSDRLRSVWAHYSWLREEAEIRGALLPSTTPCNPAPGRRFLIIRNDNPIVNSNGPFISFDGVVQSPSARRLSSMNAIPDIEVRPPSSQSSEQDFGEEETGKSRWALFRSLISATKSSSKSKNSGTAAKEVPKSPSPSKGKKETSTEKPDNSNERPSLPAHRSFSFRFSLEWVVDKRFQHPKDMRLSPPRLPLPAQFLLQSKGINIGLVSSVKPTGQSAMSARYAGRALAEWTLIAHECQNFFERRKTEGVPSNKLVETPTLAVEAFRRPG